MWTWNKTQTQLAQILAQQAQIQATQAQILTHQATLAREIRNRFDQVDDRVNDLLLKSKPGPVLIIITGEDPMDLITFNIILPPIGAPDVVVREINVSIDSQTILAQNLSADTTIIENLSGPQGAQVDVRLADIDDAGNRSGWAHASVILADTFSPPTPDGVGFVLTGEVRVEDPAPENTPPGDIGETIIPPTPEIVDEAELAADPAPEDPEA